MNTSLLTKQLKKEDNEWFKGRWEEEIKKLPTEERNKWIAPGWGPPDYTLYTHSELLYSQSVAREHQNIDTFKEICIEINNRKRERKI